MTLLVAWLWQALLLVAVVAIALRALPRVNAATRHAVWWMALLAVLLLPAVANTGTGSRHVSDTEAARPEQAAVRDGESWLATLPSVPDAALAALVAAWTVSALLALARVGAGIAAMQRLKGASRPMPESTQAQLRTWMSWRDRGRRVEVRLSDHHSGASALGLRSPVILVSAALTEVLDAEELDAIVMHEYAHLARRDDWTRLAQGFVEAIAGLHPAVRLIARRIDLEREAACDDWVVTETMDARRYAECLAELSVHMATRPVPAVHAVMPGASGSRGSLLTRVSRLARADLDRGRGLSRHALLIATFGAAGVLWLGSTLRPAIVFADAIEDTDAAREGRVTIETVPAPGVVTAGDQTTPMARVQARLARPPVSTTVRPAGRQPAPAISTAQPRLTKTALPSSDHDAPAPLPERSTLAAHALPSPLHMAPGVPATQPPLSAADATPDENPWARIGRGGAAVGSGAARAGTSIAGATSKAGLSLAGFFNRAGKAAGDRF